MATVCKTDLNDPTSDTLPAVVIPAGTPLKQGDFEDKDWQYLEDNDLLMEQDEWDEEQEQREELARGTDDQPPGVPGATSALDQEAAELRKMHAELEGRVSKLEKGSNKPADKPAATPAKG